MNTRELTAPLNASLSSGSEGTVLATPSSQEPRFEVYQAPGSLCSQKVRAVLLETDSSCRIHDMKTLPPEIENYNPAYVRIRLAGRGGRPMARGYSGASSVDTEGFDALVVPTMVDHVAGDVIVDSARICGEIVVRSGSEAELYPKTLRDAIDRQIAIVDRTPHVAILYGAHPDHDVRPDMIRQLMPNVHEVKIDAVEKARVLAGEDSALIDAYDAKVAKECAGREFVHDEQRMRDALAQVEAIIAALEAELSDGREYVTGDSFTMADSFWAVSLFRFEWLGMASDLWSDRPAVARYAELVTERDAFRRAVVEWPGMPISEYVQHRLGDRASPEWA